jgi:Flp pilus assembly protein TadG
MARARQPWLVLDRRGTALIEYAIILPTLLLFFLGIFDTGRLLFNYATLYRAVEAAARCGAVNTVDCNTAAKIQTEAIDQAWGMTVTASNFTVTTPACGTQVAASYSFSFTIPGFSAITLAPIACHPNQI